MGTGKVYVERSGKLQKTAVQFRNEEQLLNLARRIVSKVGRESMNRIHLVVLDWMMVAVSMY
ncbi:hypothetical protein O9992_22025 [Vibrio lentus]|nr:hypothetical protein [Vibrio lentus]